MTDKYTLAAQNLLYNRPLYKYIGTDETNMNVLVLGWNHFLEMFVDQCLQAGQMDSHFLNIKVLTSEAEGKKQEYLKERPALGDFVNVNGSLAESGLEIYASLNFEEFDTEDFVSAAADDVTDKMMDILADAPDEKYHYFMIDIGNENINRRVAVILKETVDAFMPSEICSIHYSSESGDEAVLSEGIVPVCIDGLGSIADIDPDLERMAYNAHLTWEDSINGDAIAELERFKANRYDYLSSIALALSVKYKLADFGITSDDNHVAADEFWHLIHREENQEAVNRVIALEHRRWVLNMVCQGWTAPRPEERQKYYDDCIERRKVKDDAEKIHPCIVRSTVDTPLSTGIFSQDKTAWDVKQTERDASLDELDRMSVELHRRMMVKANAYRITLSISIRF